VEGGGCGGAWSRPAGGVLTDRGVCGRCCLNRGAPEVSDAWALADSGRERERREVGHVGQPGKKGKWAEPQGTGGFFIYSNRIQTSSNGFDQKVDLP
jgi:hypothetical protein